MPINTNIQIPYSPFLDQATGRPAGEWLLWLMNPKVIQIDLANALGVTSGGTGLSQIPTAGQLLIGNGTGYTLDTLTPGNYIGVTNGPGSIELEWLNLLPPAIDYGPDIEKIRNELANQPSNQTGELQQQINTLRQEVQTAPKPELGSMAPLEQDNVPWLTFNNAPSPVPTAVGSMYWDGGTTMNVQMTTNVLGRINETEFVYVKASSAITKGQLCYHTGAVGASGVITAAPSPLNLVDPNQIVGVAAEDIALNAFGLIQISGVLRGFNTTGASVGETWADGDPLYYNPAYVGSFTNVKPVAPNQKTFMGEVISAGSGSSGSINIRIVTSSILGGTDSNVQFGTLANKDLIQYDSTLLYWKNVAATSVAVGNLAGGAANQIPYQSAPSTTTFSPNFLYDGTNMAVGGSLNASYRLNLVGAGLSWGNDTTVRGVNTYDASNVYIGSFTNTPVVVNVNNTQRLKLDTSGNFIISGTAQRLQGDFSNATQNNRLLFQSSTVNGNTLIGAVPNGTATTAGLQVYNAADPTNSSTGTFAVNGTTDVRVTSGAIGTGTQLPLTMYVNGSERVRIDTTGYVGIGTATVAPVSPLEVNGTVTVSGTARRIQGDFSNATQNNRVLFQSSTTNGNTLVGAVPNGTSTTAGWQVFNAADPTNSSTGSLQVNAATDIRLTSGAIGTGTQLPMTFYVNGSERIRIATSGFVGIGTSTATPTAQLELGAGNLLFSSTAQRITGDFTNATLSNRLAFQNSVSNGNTVVPAIPNGTSTVGGWRGYGASDPTNANSISIAQIGTTESRVSSEITGTATYAPMTFYTGGSERMRIDTSGNVGIGAASSGNKLEVYSANCIVSSRGTAGYGSFYALGSGTNNAYLFMGNVTSGEQGRITSENGGALVFSNTASATERMRIDSSGNVGIGGSPAAYEKLRITNWSSSLGFTYGVTSTGTVPSTTTNGLINFSSVAATQAASFTLSTLYHFQAYQSTIGAGSTVTYQYGFFASSTMTGATNNYGFYGDIASGTNRYNLYMGGSAQNYLAGNTGVGILPSSITRFRVQGADSTNSNYTLECVNSSVATFFVRNDGLILTGSSAASPYNNTTASAANMYVDSTGYLYRSTSSLRYKTDVQDAEHGLADVLKLRSVTYKGKNDGEKTFGGLIAEEVHDAGLTEFVVYDDNGQPDALHYGNMVGLLAKAMQEQQAIIDDLKARIAVLESR